MRRAAARASPGGTIVSLLSRTSTSPVAAREALVDRGREAAVLVVAQHAHARVALGERGEVLARAVARAVVDHDQLEVGVVGVEQNALEAEPREGEVVGRDDDDGGVVPAASEPIAAGLRNRAAEHRLDASRAADVVGRRETGHEVERRRETRVPLDARAGQRSLRPSSSSRPSTTSASKYSRAISKAA